MVVCVAVSISGPAHGVSGVATPSLEPERRHVPFFDASPKTLWARICTRVIRSYLYWRENRPEKPSFTCVAVVFPLVQKTSKFGYSFLILR